MSKEDELLLDMAYREINWCKAFKLDIEMNKDKYLNIPESEKLTLIGHTDEIQNTVKNSSYK